MGLFRMLKGEEPGLIDQIKHSGDKGRFGEYLTDFALSNDNLEGRLVTFDNLILPYRGRTTEVDVLMLHEKGVFVFESKNYSGWIFGSEDQRQWTQCLKGGQKNRFGNPIKQNRSHIRALSQALDVPEANFHSYIVFSERCTLKKVPDDISEYVILRRHHLLRQVRKKLAALDVAFDDERFGEIRRTIETLQNGQVSNEEHVDNVQRLLSNEICPWCGRELVLRNGKYGSFLGCSGYPACRYTLSNRRA